MEGNNVYKSSINTGNSIIVLGNEANGITANIQSHIDEKISIPNYGSAKGAESLNVAMAGAILLSEFKRR
jgi:TrmH family RNA methyltransferase